MLKQTIMLNTDPWLYATVVVLGMVSAGLMLGAVLDYIMRWFGLQIERGDRG